MNNAQAEPQEELCCSHVGQEDRKTQMGLNAPQGYGWLTNPKKATYSRVYNLTSFSL
ncbi:MULTISPECIES: hypothetical protein [unclassified Mesorhizobium]|uniref:hypothetical protein n=1 Tax=unclassified Mesorhizobium TaxID=325217 RepID=UPI00333BEC5F